MTRQGMQRTDINGAKLTIRDRGTGEPLVFIHGGMGDECAAVLTEPALASQYRLIDYHRRGYGDSECPAVPVSIEQQAADCRAVMRHLGIDRAQFVGQSYGGAILLQMTLDAPHAVHSLALLEPALPSVVLNYPAFSAMMSEAMSMYESGDKARAIDTFAREVCGADYRTLFDQTLPPGHFERWVAAADTIFQGEIPALQSWDFTSADAARITQPVLNIMGANTAPYFRQIYETLRTWFPHAESFVLPNATHAMLQTNPKEAAERIASFLSRHAMQGS